MEQSALAEVASQNPAPDDLGPLLPICKLVSRKVEKTKQIAKKTEKKVNPSLTLKTVELNWAIDPHDLSHRIERIREFLRKGFRVDVLMAPKRKGRKAEEQEARGVLRKVREVADSVEGAKEWKGMEGKVGGTATVYLEGKSI
jgi:translation initiation factor IF-3